MGKIFCHLEVEVILVKDWGNLVNGKLQAS